jgi:hypothetical protein
MDAKDPGVNLWTRRVWPLLAGALVAVGLCGAAVMQGVLLTALTVVLFFGLVSICVHVTFSDDGMTPLRALRIGALSSLAMVVLLGLGLLDAQIGWSAAGAVALTSPPVLGRAAAWRKERRSRHQPPHLDVDALDDAEVARRFEAIVASLGNKGTSS